ncbi:MAG: Holliday junction resolvase RuvX, partial [Candidatus Zixiibacteriota bacterium]
LALSDPLGITAQGLPTIDTKKIKDVLAYIKDLVVEKDVAKLVVGMPRNMNGSIGPQGEKVKKFIGKLAHKTEAEVIAWDERLTSVQSLKSMREMGTKQKRKEVTDRISATLILQSYLDSLSNREKRSPTDEI